MALVIKGCWVAAKATPLEHSIVAKTIKASLFIGFFPFSHPLNTQNSKAGAGGPVSASRTGFVQYSNVPEGLQPATSAVVILPRATASAVAALGRTCCLAILARRSDPNLERCLGAEFAQTESPLGRIYCPEVPVHRRRRGRGHSWSAQVPKVRQARQQVQPRELLFS